MRAVFGLDRFASGEIRVRGKRVRISSVKDSKAAKIAMLSEDRRRYGLVSVRSVRENVSLSNLRQFIYRGRLHGSKETKFVSDICARLNVKTPSLEHGRRSPERREPAEGRAREMDVERA